MHKYLIGLSYTAVIGLPVTALTVGVLLRFPNLRLNLWKELQDKQCKVLQNSYRWNPLAILM